MAKRDIIASATRLEEGFERLCKGDYQAILELSIADSRELEAFALTRLCQLWTEIEQRTRI